MVYLSRSVLIGEPCHQMRDSVGQGAERIAGKVRAMHVFPHRHELDGDVAVDSRSRSATTGRCLM